MTTNGTPRLTLSPSLVAGGLVVTAGNLVPLYGVLSLGWSLTAVLVVYWLESGLVGLLTVPRILVAGADGPLGTLDSADLNRSDAAFFAMHYGLFWVVHGVFVGIFANWLGWPTLPTLATLAVGTASLLVAHLGSFGGYLLGSYAEATADGQFFAPYPRVLALHVTIVLGGVPVVALGTPLALVGLLVGLKAAVDVGVFAYDRGVA